MRHLRQSIVVALMLVLAGPVPGPRPLSFSGSASAQDRSPQERAPQERTPPANAQKGGGRQGNQGDANAQPPTTTVVSLLPSDSVTSKTLKIRDGVQIDYTATVGTLDLTGQDGERKAVVTYTAYVAKNAPAGRPLTFAFNGGPGAGSAYLHLGVAGPKILDFGPNANDATNARLIDNPDSWLAFTDLVFVDPVGTGWSRSVRADDNGFYNVQADTDSVAKIVSLYVSRNSRMAAPKYLLGESYGGFRAAKVATRLLQDQGIALSGILMMSPFLEGEFTFGSPRRPLNAAMLLPSLAAAELQRKGAYSADAQKSAEQFALGEYLSTIAGPAPTGAAADTFYGRVAAMTGLSPDAVRKARGLLRDAYVKQIREAAGEIVSIYDVNLSAPDPYPELRAARGSDPVLEGFTRAYGGAFAAYARDELGFKTDMTYVLLSRDIAGKWDWGRGGISQASADDDIRQQLSLTPSLRLLIMHGRSDIVTPYAASKFVLDHLPGEIASRAALKTYAGGHMFYTQPDSRMTATADVRAFYTAKPAPPKD